MLKTIVKGCEPTRGSKYSSCIDLYASETVVIGAGQIKIVPLGVQIDLDAIKSWDRFWFPSMDGKDKIFDEKEFELFMSSYCMELKCRSSLPVKKRLVISNGVGEIDIDYNQEIGIILHQPFPSITHDYTKVDGIMIYNPITIKKGDKIAQIKLVKHYSNYFGISTEDDRDGGYGSTDKKDENR